MSTAPMAWIVDDGELDDVRELLTLAKVPYGEGESSRAVEVQLLVTSARRALVEKQKLPVAGTHLIVYAEESRSLRKVLERSGCDLVMPLPLNADAFRLLMNFALYSGPEKRRSRRVVLSAPVKINGGLRGSATLVSLSLRGCGLVMKSESRVGKEVKIRLPKTLTETQEVTLAARVLSSHQVERGRNEVALAFRLVDVGTRRLLSDIMTRHAAGAELRPRKAPRLKNGEDEATGERRIAPRKRFTRRVLAAGAGIAHVLIGRDLSSGGMRVRPDPDLQLGDVLKLAVHGHPGQPAIMLKAVVIRDDGDDGVVLRFQEIPPTIANRLEEMVIKLPTLPRGKRPGEVAPGNVVTEVVGRG